MSEFCFESRLIHRRAHSDLRIASDPIDRLAGRIGIEIQSGYAPIDDVVLELIRVSALTRSRRSSTLDWTIETKNRPLHDGIGGTVA